jgi:hypothetical protein
MATTVPNTFVNGTNADATQMNANFAAVTAAVDGVAAAAGVTTPAPKMRGMSSVAGAENRVSAAYGLMATPDRVTGIVLPTNGLLVVTFQAWWNESVSAAARAAIFLGSNQLKIASNTASAPSVQEAGGDRPRLRASSRSWPPDVRRTFTPYVRRLRLRARTTRRWTRSWLRPVVACRTCKDQIGTQQARDVTDYARSRRR